MLCVATVVCFVKTCVCVCFQEPRQGGVWTFQGCVLIGVWQTCAVLVREECVCGLVYVEAAHAAWLLRLRGLLMVMLGCWLYT